MATGGFVPEWHDDEGWGVVDSSDTPDGCWAHFSSVDLAGYRSLPTGQVVTFEFEDAAQDGYAFRARHVGKGRGSIVNVASIGGVTGGAAGIAYTASKHALVGMTKNTAYFYGPQGVRCNLVCPGGVETNIADGGAAPKSDWAWERMQAGFGLAQRMASAEEISSLIVWLSADESVNVNGAVMASDGGWTAS